jgi:hypothetical protein
MHKNLIPAWIMRDTGPVPEFHWALLILYGSVRGGGGMRGEQMEESFRTGQWGYRMPSMKLY